MAVRPRAAFCVNDQRVALEAARRGLGMVLAPVELLAASGLSVLDLAPEVGVPEPRELHAVYPSRRLVPKRVRLAVDWVARASRSGER